ncbi:hypothetical protein BCU68_00215 [Vibrio sp. 10N.286.49.B3]|uniref:hypothetical protein n=1 Tax=Vibrio sp. 10N.286.49.B3 TaxID=1880855 RepID=UPI000C81DD70|nr:hypothetical protein [Vibrio sp. 10N.286.49.B3]PMH46511.1 hypothetical protein BCU68_00215 [Vibrio sp. 10N.286.49.B3]
MAAERLTKQRLWQISITLLVLFVAYAWGTLSSKQPSTLECSKAYPCYIHFWGEKLSISKNKNNYFIQGLILDEASVKIEKGTSKIASNPNGVNILDTQEELIISFSKSDQETIYLKLNDY